MIILGKYKDYYDYIVGTYGRDEDIVFDRKDAVVLNSNQDNHNPLWYKEELKWLPDIKKSTKKLFKWSIKNPYIDLTKPHGRIEYVGVEIGYKVYIFLVERYLDGSNDVQIEPRLIQISDVVKKASESPINIIPYTDRLRGGFDFNLVPTSPGRIIKNPILSNTWIPKFISAEDVYSNVYNYLISVKDKKIVDTRTEEQKAQSHGFNKESFRNPIRLKDLK